MTTSFDYYDGDEKRTVWLSTNLVAEFAPSAAGKDALLHSDSGAKEVAQGQPGVRIWSVSASQGTEVFARNASTDLARFTPVLHVGPSPALPMRALPGGVVATFAASWDRVRIDAWLAARNLRVESEVVAGANMYLLATPAGVESIHIANQLYETRELVGATPNFWVQASAR